MNPAESEKNSGIGNFLDKRRQSYHYVPSKVCCNSTKKVRGVTCLSIGKMPNAVIEEFCGWEMGVYYVSPSKYCCLAVPKKVVGETFGVSENFWYRKILSLREVGGYQDFPCKLFRLTIKTIHRGTLLSIRNFLLWNFLWIGGERGGGVNMIFFQESLFSYSNKNIRTGTLLSSKKFVLSKDYLEKSGGELFSRSCVGKMSHSIKKVRLWTFLRARKFWYRKISWIKEWGVITMFHPRFVVSQYQKNS